MWVVNIDQPMAAEFIGYGLFPSWCPVAGTGDQGRGQDCVPAPPASGATAPFSVWTVDYKAGDASSPTEVATHPAAACINPTWSPDGAWIVFASVPVGGEPSSVSIARPAVADLWMCAIDGSSRVNLTTGRSVNLMPAWGADSRIYFVSDRAGIENIWSIGTEKALLAATGGRAPADAPPGVETTRVHTKKVPELTTVPDNHTAKPGH